MDFFFWLLHLASLAFMLGTSFVFAEFGDFCFGTLAHTSHVTCCGVTTPFLLAFLQSESEFLNLFHTFSYNLASDSPAWNNYGDLDPLRKSFEVQDFR